MDLGSFSLTMEGLIMHSISNGPNNKGSLGFCIEGNVSRREPELLAWLIVGCRCPVAVGDALIAVSESEQGHAIIRLDLVTLAVVSLDRWYGDVVFMSSKQWVLMAQGTFEGWYTGGGTGQGVTGIFKSREFCAPGSWVLGRNAVEFCNQVLVGSLCLAVGLWVVT